MAYLQHDRLFGGSRSGEVLHVPAAFVVERRPAGFVLPVPLDDEVAVEEVLLLRRLAPQSQEVTCLLHFLYQDVPRPLRYHAHVHVPWGEWRAESESQRGNGWPTMAAATLTSRLPDSLPLIFNRGWAQSVGVVGMCVCVCVFGVGGTALSVFYCVWMGGGWMGEDESSYE